MPSAWTRLRGALDPLARAYGHYTAYRLHASEYVGHVPDMTTRSARWYLTDEGYTPQYLSAAKRHPETGALHDLSYRHVSDAHPDGATGTAITDASPRACQLHVHAFETVGGRETQSDSRAHENAPRSRGGMDFFSHYEYRPLARPWRHYRPEYGQTYLRGVTNLELSHG